MRNVMEVTYDEGTYQVKSSFEDGLDVLNIISMLATKFKSSASTESEKCVADALLTASMQGRTFSRDEKGDVYISEDEGELVDNSKD